MIATPKNLTDWYEYGDLAPVLSEEAVHLHFDGHYHNYVKTFNKAIVKFKSSKNIMDILRSKYVAQMEPTLFNNAGGVFNHEFFFEGLAPYKSDNTVISKDLSKLLTRYFGSVVHAKSALADAALNIFGSGWAWLVYTNGSLKVVTTKNQDTPFLTKARPLLAIDMWEHAYYKDYDNRKKDFIDNFFNIVNWTVVEQRYNALKETT